MNEDSPGFRVHVLDRDWLNGENFELTCTRPENFSFLAGQHVSLGHGDLERDYTITSAIDAPELRFLIKRMGGHGMSDQLADIPPGTALAMGRATGYLTFRPAGRATIFVATGVGVAPFVAMAASGVRGFTLIQGARTASGLLYRSQLESAAAIWVGCVSGEDAESASATAIVHGRVTDYIDAHLPPGAYDFYLCGSRPMIHDVTHLIDQRFPDARVYSEAYN